LLDFETEIYGANNTEQIKLSLSLGDWPNERHIREYDGNVARTCRAQQGMLLLDPSVHVHASGF
jgi:hypothetical protein